MNSDGKMAEYGFDCMKVRTKRVCKLEKLCEKWYDKFVTISKNCAFIHNQSLRMGREAGMRRTMIQTLAVCLLVIGMITGCGAPDKVTAESLLNDVAKNTEAMKSMESHTTVDMTMEAPELGGSMDMTMDLTMQTLIEPTANYMKGSIGLMGMTMDMENYAIVEEDEIVNYTGMMGEWMVQRMPYDTESENTLDTAQGNLLKNLDSLTLAEETEDVDGTEAYIISGTVEGEDIESLLGEMESVLGDMTGEGAMDLSKLSVEFKYAIDKQKKLPLYMDMTFNGFSVDDGQTAVNVSNFVMRIEYTAFNSVESIEVPQDVVDSAVDMTGQM